MSANAEHVRDEMYRVIQDDPTIKDASHISVTVFKQGLFGKKALELRGRVESPLDKKRIDDIVRSRSRGLEVIDNLRVDEGHGKLH